MKAIVRRCLFVAALIAAPLTMSGAPVTSRSPGRLALHTCEVPGIPEGGRCGAFRVHENRTATAGREIALNVVVLPATGPSRREPVFWLEGGPGGAATSAIGPVSQQYLRGVRSDRDLVFVDQRGTGRSNPLECDLGDSPADLDRYFGPLFPLDLVRACREKLERIADLTQYTTSVAADDLDDVREALGYSTINVAGASYGTQAALVYMRRHREHVRSAFLVGVAPPDFRLPLPFARAAQHALEMTLSDCAFDRSCHAAFPDVRREFDAVLARFDRGPVQVSMTDPANGRPRRVTLTRESYVEHVRLQLYHTFGARMIPLVVHEAFLGNFVPFQRATSSHPSMARGMYLSVTCSEDTPFITETDIVQQTRGTFLGDRRIRAHVAACAEWPHARVPRAFLDPVTSDVPTVLYSGEADGSTPPWVADAAARFLSNGRLIRVPHTGHQISGPCGWDLMRDFINRPVPGELDAACVNGALRPPFVTDVPR